MKTEAGPSNSSTISDLGDLFQKHDGLEARLDWDVKRVSRNDDSEQNNPFEKFACEEEGRYGEAVNVAYEMEEDILYFLKMVFT